MGVPPPLFAQNSAKIINLIFIPFPYLIWGQEIPPSPPTLHLKTPRLTHFKSLSKPDTLDLKSCIWMDIFRMAESTLFCTLPLPCLTVRSRWSLVLSDVRVVGSFRAGGVHDSLWWGDQACVDKVQHWFVIGTLWNKDMFCSCSIWRNKVFSFIGLLIEHDHVKNDQKGDDDLLKVG